MLVTISATTVPNYQRGGDTAELRIYATDDFFQDGIEYVSGLGYFYKSVTCPVVGTSVTIPSFTLQSTVDSLVDTARYTTILFDYLGNKVAVLMNGMEFGVPPTTPTTWEDLRIYAAAPRRRLTDSYYTANQIDARLDELEEQIEDLPTSDVVTPEDYNAVGDMIYGMDGSVSSSSNVFTSASANFSDANSLATGKVIVINGAGVGGAPLVTTVNAVNSAVELELADNASTTVSGSAIYYYGTDDLTSFQAMINDLTTRGGGRVILGLKKYLISDELTLPSIEFQNEQVVIIEFVGANGPVTSYWNNTNQVIGGDNDVVLSTEGQTIVQLAKTVPGTKLLDVDWTLPLSNAPSGVIFTAKDMVFRVPTKSNVTGLDLQYAYSARLLNVNIEPADHQSNLGEPLAGNFGVILPRIGNGGGIYCKELHITGFDTGLRHAEHTVLDHIWIQRCQFGIMVDATHLASEYRRVMLNTCPYGVISESNTPATPKPFIYGGPIDFEDSFSIASPAAHWSAPKAHINDPGDNLRGELAYLRTVGFQGYERGLTVFGASKLLRKEVGQRMYDGGVENVGVLPFACALTSPIGEDAPPEENTGQAWMLRPANTFVVFDADGAYFATGSGNCFARLEAEVSNYKLGVRVDIDAVATGTQAGLCVKYIQGGVGATGGTYIGVTIEKFGATNQLRLFKVENGAATTRGTDTSVTFAVNTNYLLEVDYDDGDIEIFVDGVSKITYSLTADELITFDKSKVFGLYSFIGASNDDRTTQFRDFSAIES